MPIQGGLSVGGQDFAFVRIVEIPLARGELRIEVSAAACGNDIYYAGELARAHLSVVFTSCIGCFQFQSCMGEKRRCAWPPGAQRGIYAKSMGWERWRWRATTNLGRAANRAVRDCLRRDPSRGGRDEARPSRGGRHQVVTEGSDCVQRVVYGMRAMALARDHESWPGGESRSARLSAARHIPA